LHGPPLPERKGEGIHRTGTSYAIRLYGTNRSFRKYPNQPEKDKTHIFQKIFHHLNMPTLPSVSTLFDTSTFGTTGQTTGQVPIPTTNKNIDTQLQNTTMKSPVVPESLQNTPETCQELLRKCEMFHNLVPGDISQLANLMQYRVFHRNDVLSRQGVPVESFFLLESGDIRRDYFDPETKRKHNVEFAIKAKSINSMRIISGETAHNTVRCVSDTCKVYEMKRTEFLNLLQHKPEITVKIAESLCEELRRGSKKYQTPLLEQKQTDVNIPAVSIAAGIESYYRSALNAMLNARLTGVRAEYFPNMHIQVPSRIAYVTGFKGLRAYLDKAVDPDVYAHPTSIRLIEAIAPGLIMTPVSGLLEASNAGHMNKESMATRWMRGIIPRAGREIIFGIGLNQLSDYFEERIQPMVFHNNAMMANAAGSLCAGVVSGYLSHVPHNMSTFKIMQPHRTYPDLFRMFVDQSTPPVIDRAVQTWPAVTQFTTRAVFATLFPRGVMIRTVQIVGSFIILNGAINHLQLRDQMKIQRALAAT
jgi:hypothetical protein